MRRIIKGLAVVAATAVVSLAVLTPAHADELRPVDANGGTASKNLTYAGTTSQGDTYACSSRGRAEAGTGALRFRDAGDDFLNGETVKISGLSAVAGITVTGGTDLTMPNPIVRSNPGQSPDMAFSFSTTVATTVVDTSTGHDVTITLTGQTSDVELTDTFKVFVDCGVSAPSNAAPVLATPVATATSACGVSVSGTFTDTDGVNQTHTGTIDFGEGDGVETATVDKPVGGPWTVSGSHTYVTDGIFAITVEVSDGTDSDSEQISHTTKLAASTLGEPIKPGGASTFKIGSSIPLKITVTNCAGNLVTNLTPTVGLRKVDSFVDGETVTPIEATEAATNGKQMRWNGEHYHYVLSTKNSQFNGGLSLTPGTYEVAIGDASFFAPAKARFDLKK